MSMLEFGAVLILWWSSLRQGKAFGELFGRLAIVTYRLMKRFLEIHTQQLEAHGLTSAQTRYEFVQSSFGKYLAGG